VLVALRRGLLLTHDHAPRSGSRRRCSSLECAGPFLKIVVSREPPSTRSHIESGRSSGTLGHHAERITAANSASDVVVGNQRRRERCGDVFVEQVVRAVAGVRQFAGDHLEDDATEGIDIRARDRAAFRGSARATCSCVCLGSVWSCQRKILASPFLDLLRDGEVDDLDFAIAADQKVVRLDVAVHIALGCA
jgi:hypothetical protein